MRRTHRLSARTRCGVSICVCFALLFSVAGGIPLRSASSEGATHRPSRPNLPTLDEVKHRQVQAPRAAAAVSSTIRSRRRPLESRNGRRVGDPLPTPRATPVATPSALPAPPRSAPSPSASPSPTPRAMYNKPKFGQFGPVLLASYLRTGSMFSILALSGFNYPLSRQGRISLPLSDSPMPLFVSGNLSFDVAPVPIPQAGGLKIVFASSRDGFMQIYVMNSDGTVQTRLTTDGSNNENPRWSPDGTKILFQSDRDNPGNGMRDIYVMNSNGQTRLTTDANDDMTAR